MRDYVNIGALGLKYSAFLSSELLASCQFLVSGLKKKERKNCKILQSDLMGKISAFIHNLL